MQGRGKSVTGGQLSKAVDGSDCRVASHWFPVFTIARCSIRQQIWSCPSSFCPISVRGGEGVSEPSSSSFRVASMIVLTESMIVERVYRANLDIFTECADRVDGGGRASCNSGLKNLP